MATDVLNRQEPFGEACARRSREADALSAHARDMADWLDKHPDIVALDAMKLRRQRDDLRRVAHDLDDISQGLRDLARGAS